MQLKPVNLALLMLWLNTTTVATGVDTGEGKRNLKPVAVFIPNYFFRDDEYQVITSVLERAKIPFVVVGNDTTAAQGIDGLLVKPSALLNEITPADFSAIVLTSGSGLFAYWKDTVLLNRCESFAREGRIVAAVELGPLILARAGVLRNKSATVFPDFYCIQVLKENGARYRFGGVVRDGNIITAAKAEDTHRLVRTLVRMLKQKP